jgi:TetR/AcrR family transcriptional regulator, transcriptional repressor of aconitase
VPKVSQEHLDARRAQILDGARRAFSRYGYDGATVVRLEEETGLSRGAIFHYYPSKREIFAAIAIEDSRRYIDLLVDGGLDDAVRAMAGEDREWLGVVLETQGRLRPDEEFHRRLEEESAGDQQRVIDWFDARRLDGSFRDDISALELGRFATMVINGLALRVAGGDETDVDSLLRLLHDAVSPRS